MATIETLISCFLDGELTPTEQAQLQRLLAESPDARALMREMTEVARAARRIPKLHTPAVPLEAKLFQRLEAEGLHRKPAPQAPKAPVPSPALKGRGVAAAALVLLLLVIGGSYLRFGASEMAHAPVVPGFAGRAAGNALAAGSMLSPVVADHGGMVNIPEVLLRPATAPAHRGGSPVARRAPLHVAPSRNVLVTPADTLPLASTNAPAMAETVTPREELPPSSRPATEDHAGALVPTAPVVPGIAPMNRWIASFRGGIATVDDDAGTMVRELDMKVGMQMEGGHKVSFIVGMAPSINETRRENTGVAMSSPAFSQVPDATDGAGNKRSDDEITSFERTVRSEPWFGVAYNYSIPVVKSISLDPGMKAGASASTWRIGAELPVSLRMSKNMSLECAVSVAHVLPRKGGDGATMALTDTPDHFIYQESKQQTSFTTYGVQLGIRLELETGR